MKKLLLVISLLSFANSFAQQTTPKGAWLEKWENSKNYLIGIAEAMPEEYYDFKPTERQMTFKEQLLHIQSNMEWLGAKYLNKEESEISIVENEKERIIKTLENSFNYVAKAVKDTDTSKLSETVDFFAGQKSKLQILNLLQDHVTHHRGQLIVYLNLKDVEPPGYSGW